MDADSGSAEHSKDGLKEQIASIVEPELKDLDLSEPSRRKVEQVVQRAVSLVAYRGPLPPPSMLEEYERLIPGFSKQLSDNFIKESDFRRNNATIALQASISAGKRGQWLAATLVVFFGFIALYLGLAGHDWLAGCIAITTVGSVLGAFVVGSRANSSPSDGGDEPDEEVPPPGRKTLPSKPGGGPKKRRKR